MGKKISNMISDAFGVVKDPTVVMSTTLLVDSVLGTFASGLYAMKSSYKFKRMEENVEIAIKELINRLEAVELNLSDVNYRMLEKSVFPTFWDFVIDEPESEKIQLFVNGIVVASQQEEIDMEMIYIYFSTLSQLRVKEIMFFQDVYIQKNYKVTDASFGINIPDEIDYTYHTYAQNKLEKVGLIYLAVISGNGTIDEHYIVTGLGEKLYVYFNELNGSSV